MIPITQKITWDLTSQQPTRIKHQANLIAQLLTIQCKFLTYKIHGNFLLLFS